MLNKSIVSLLFVTSASIAIAERPNIVFIMSDDHAYQAISAYGSGLNATPNIDRIYQAGLRFDRAYVEDSICAPSRAAILTSKYSHKNGVLDNFTDFDGSQLTFPKLLREIGYQTALIGKWHLKTDPTGFDHWDILRGQGKYYRPDFRNKKGIRPIEGYVTDITTNLAIDWLEGKGETGRDSDKPFLLMLHHKAPHRPWDPAVRHLSKYKDQNFPEPETLYDDYATRTSAPRDAEMKISEMRPDVDLKVWTDDNKHRKWLYDHMSDESLGAWVTEIDPRYKEFNENKLTGKERTRWMWQHYLEDYLGCVASVDESVGHVLDWLQENNLSENTVIVYTSDQGFYLGEHGWFDKRFMYEESLRTPLLISWPAGRSDWNKKSLPINESHIVSNLDFGPTFLELAGGDPMLLEKAGGDGISFASILRGEDFPSARNHFYYHYHEGPKRDHAVARHDGITTGQLKLIHFYELNEWELYDLQSDPMEIVNRYDDPLYHEQLENLKALLESERRRLRVSIPAAKKTNLIIHQ